MRSASKARYALAALIDLAMQQSRRPVALAEIAQRQKISVSYLEQLFARLRLAGVIRSVRGPGGGYVLTRHPHEISIGDVHAAVMGKTSPPAALGTAGVQARTRALWQLVETETAKVLQRINLQQVLDNNGHDATA